MLRTSSEHVVRVTIGVALVLGVFATVETAQSQDSSSLERAVVTNVFPSGARVAQAPDDTPTPAEGAPTPGNGAQTGGAEGGISDDATQLPDRIPSPLDNIRGPFNQGRTTNAATPRRRSSPLASQSGNQRAPRSGLPTVIGDFFSPGQTQNITIGSIRLIPLPDAGMPRFVITNADIQAARANGFENTTFNRVATFRHLDRNADGILDDSSPITPINVALRFNMTNADFNAFADGRADGSGFSLFGVMADPGADLLALAEAEFAAQMLRAGGEVRHNSSLSNASGEFFTGPEEFEFTPTYAYDYVFAVQAPTPGSGGTLGRVKLSDNSSPIPRDRLYFDYNYFNNAALTAQGVNVHRYSPGFEKALFGGVASIEARFPMGVSLDSNVIQDGPNSVSSSEFGNIAVTSKFLLFQNDRFLVSGGAGFSIPTADDLNVGFADGTRLARVQNQSLHVIPFIGTVFTPNDTVFVQSYIMVDVDATGSTVFLNPTGMAGTNLVNAGRLQDQTLLFADVSMGRWLYRGARPNQLGVTGVATVAEVHYNTSVQTADEVRSGSLAFGDPTTNISQVSLTLGSHFEFRRGNILTLGYNAPLGGARQPYDGELRAYVNLMQ